MDIPALKKEAIRQFAIRVETADEQILKMILDFLQGIKSDDENGLNLSQHYDHIKLKYRSVLKRLAE